MSYIIHFSHSHWKMAALCALVHSYVFSQNAVMCWTRPVVRLWPALYAGHVPRFDASVWQRCHSEDSSSISSVPLGAHIFKGSRRRLQMSLRAANDANKIEDWVRKWELVRHKDVSQTLPFQEADAPRRRDGDRVTISISVLQSDQIVLSEASCNPILPLVQNEINQLSIVENNIWFSYMVDLFYITTKNKLFQMNQYRIISSTTYHDTNRIVVEWKSLVISLSLPVSSTKSH